MGVIEALMPAIVWIAVICAIAVLIEFIVNWVRYDLREGVAVLLITVLTVVGSTILLLLGITGVLALFGVQWGELL